jgi:hypothetical protein
MRGFHLVGIERMEMPGNGMPSLSSFALPVLASLSDPKGRIPPSHELVVNRK